MFCNAYKAHIVLTTVTARSTIFSYPQFYERMGKVVGNLQFSSSVFLVNIILTSFIVCHIKHHSHILQTFLSKKITIANNHNLTVILFLKNGLKNAESRINIFTTKLFNFLNLSTCYLAAAFFQTIFFVMLHH